jgi:uncharacterized protein YndB with AHSA1/START domain
MSEPLIITNTITIKAPRSTVWDALTNPAKTKQYMYGCEVITDWKPGSTIFWDGENEGQVIRFVKGHVVDYRPEEYLAYTVIDPNNTEVPDIPENYLTVTYSLEEKNGETELTVTQGDYTSVADGQKRYEDSMAANGWNSILESIKSLIEEGTPLNFIPE